MKLPVATLLLATSAHATSNMQRKAAIAKMSTKAKSQPISLPRTNEFKAEISEAFNAASTASTSKSKSSVKVSSDPTEMITVQMAYYEDAGCSGQAYSSQGMVLNNMYVCAPDGDGNYRKATDCTVDSPGGSVTMSYNTYDDAVCTNVVGDDEVELFPIEVGNCEDLGGGEGYLSYSCFESNEPWADQFDKTSDVVAVIMEYPCLGCQTTDLEPSTTYVGTDEIYTTSYMVLSNHTSEGNPLYETAETYAALKDLFVIFGTDSLNQCEAIEDGFQSIFFDYDGIPPQSISQQDVNYDGQSCHEEDDDAFCFHVDSTIDYKGVEYSYQELKDGKEAECTVPHSPFSKGVVIDTSCEKTVRVTDTHLMATSKGFQLAYSLKPGDVLFGDYAREECVVKSVKKEETVQQYFGLNCVHSEVLASGLRASTFGDFHTLPSWYMTYVGGLVGAETARSVGEYVAEWYLF